MAKRGRRAKYRHPRELPPEIQAKVVQSVQSGKSMAEVYRDLEIATAGCCLRTFQYHFGAYRKHLRTCRHVPSPARAFAQRTIANWGTRESHGFVGEVLFWMLAMHFGAQLEDGGGDA